MTILLWILPILLGLYFFFTGIVHFIVPPGRPAPMAWLYELLPGLHYFSGAAEILAGLGLVLAWSDPHSDPPNASGGAWIGARHAGGGGLAFPAQ